MALFALRFFAIGDSAFKSLNRNTMNEGSAAIRLRPDLCDDKSSLRTSPNEPEGSPMPHQFFAACCDSSVFIRAIRGTQLRYRPTTLASHNRNACHDDGTRSGFRPNPTRWMSSAIVLANDRHQRMAGEAYPCQVANNAIPLHGIVRFAILCDRRLCVQITESQHNE
jgi:hypothetical protein